MNYEVVKPGSIVECTFDTFAGATGASITMTGLAVTDIEIYKDGSTTQRSSDNGYTLLDTDGIDVDGITGFHGFTIDLADNSVAGFYAAGSRYVVVVSAITVDSQTVSFIARRFRIGLPDAVLNTTIATLASQTSFTLTAGPAEDDALNGCPVYLHDVASAVQGGFGVVLDYTGSTKTVTLAAGTTFTAAATDNISVLAPSGVRWTAGVADNAQTGDGYAIVNSGTHGNAALKTLIDAVKTVADAIKAKTDGLPSDPADASDLLAVIDVIDNYLDTEIADIQGRLPAALVGGRMDSTVDGTGMEAAAVDAILDEVVAGATTLRQLLRGFAAALLGKVSEADLNTPKFRDIADTKNVISATTDADGNRTAVTLDLT